jgi:hypothetical protein
MESLLNIYKEPSNANTKNHIKNETWNWKSELYGGEWLISIQILSFMQKLTHNGPCSKFQSQPYSMLKITFVRYLGTSHFRNLHWVIQRKDLNVHLFLDPWNPPPPSNPFWQAVGPLSTWFRSHWHLWNVVGLQSGLFLFIQISAVNRQLLLATPPEFEMTTFCV